MTKANAYDKPEELLSYPVDSGDGGDSTIAIKYMQKENQRLLRALRVAKEQIRELVTEKLLWGNDITETSTQELVDKYSIDLGDGAYILMLVRIPDPEAAQFAKERLTVRTILDTLFDEGYRPSYTTARDEDVILLSLSRDADPVQAGRQVADVAARACSAIEKSCGAAPIICVSDTADDAQAIRRAFKILMDMREYSMSLGSGPRIITPGDFPNYVPFDPDNRPFLAMTMEKQYINAVVAKDFQLARQLTFEKVTALLQDDFNGTKTLKPFLDSRLEATADLLTMSLSAISVGGRSAQEDLDELRKSRDTDTILSLLEDIYHRFDSFFNRSENEVKGIAGRVIKFVTANYHDPSLSVEIICDEMGKSRSYLSRMFKENTGMNLLDYLHITRITEAKRLLTESNLSVAEIGEKVGYYSGWTLARVFKRYEGITPSSYRDAYRKGADGAQ